MHQFAIALQLSQIRNQRSALVGRRPPIEVHAVGRRDRWDGRTWHRIRVHALEELDVVVDHFFERSGACCESTARSCGVHEVRAGRTCPSRRMARRPLQTRSAGHAQDLSSSGELRPGREQPSRTRRRNRQRNLVGSRIPGKPRRTGRQDESRRYRGVDGTRTCTSSRHDGDE
jgi:hypothetical protein